MARIGAFIVWVVVGVGFLALGIYIMNSKKAKPFGFWANAEAPEVTDVKAYNKALGKLWIIFGVGFIIIGLPLLAGENSPLIILSIIGAMMLCIGIMAYYSIAIEPKYKKK